MKDEQRKADSEWVRSLVDAHAAELCRYAASLTGDADAARDVVQDCFVRLWREDRGAIEGHIRPWLFRVCRNRAIDLRRKEARVSPLNEAQAERTASDGAGPDEVAEASDRQEQVLGLIRGLPAKQREVVRLKFQNGMSYKEIAAVTELSVTNVGFLLHTALKTLRVRAASIAE